MTLDKRIHCRFCLGLFGAIAALCIPRQAYALIEITHVQHITGTCNGSIDVTATGTAGPFTFSWTGPNGFTASTEDINNLCDPGTYTVSIGFSNSDCFTTLSAVVYGCSYEISPNPSVYPLCSTNIPNGAISLNPWGGQPPYSFNWSNGASTQNLQNLTTGVYCVTITDALGCKSPQHCVNVGVASLLGLYAYTSPPNIAPVCNGGPGTITIQPDGGRPPYSYLWNTNQTTSSINVTTSGSYTVTVTDYCSNTAGISVSYIIDPPLNVTLSSSPFICLSNTGSPHYTPISAQAVGGTPPYTYNWGGFVFFPTDEPSVIEAVLDGAYSVTVTDSYGCTTTTSTILEDRYPPNIDLISLTKNNSFGACQPDGSISVNVSSGLAPYQFSWSGPNGYASALQNISNLAQGQYCLTVTDQNGCTTTKCFYLESIGDVYLGPIQNVRECSQNESPCTGSITLNTSGSGPFTYLWYYPGGLTSTSKNIQNLCMGDYYVTVTGPNGCTKVLEASICCCRSYTEHPSTGTAANACYGEETPTSISEIQLKMVKPLTPSSLGGSIDITISGGLYPKQFAWSGPDGFTAFTEDLYNLSPGTYCVTVSDGCQKKTKCIDLKSCSDLSLSADITLNCNGFIGSLAAGHIFLNPVGGDGPYKYQWNNGKTSASLSQLDVGTFSVTITDAGGCMLNQDFTLPSRKEQVVTTYLSTCERIYTCNDVSKSESGAYFREYVGCDQFYLHCDLQPQTRIGGLHTTPVTNILSKEDCKIICRGGESYYLGEPEENHFYGCYFDGEIINEGAVCKCKYADGCKFENITINGQFFENYFVPTSGEHSVPYTITKKRIQGYPCGSGQCFYEYSCNGNVISNGPCFECQALAAPEDTIYTLNTPEFTLRDYLTYLLSDEVKSFGVVLDADLDMLLQDYFDLIDSMNLLPLKTVGIDSLRKFNTASSISEYLVFPNPFTAEINIQGKHLNGIPDVTIQIYNALGSMVRKEYYPVPEGKLDILIPTGEWPSGLYTIDICTQQSRSVYKLIKFKTE